MKQPLEEISSVNHVKRDKLDRAGHQPRAVNFLKQQGYTKVKNVAGGINAWADRIDPNVPQY